MKIGLFFGSFNPIHIGHLIIAQTVLDQADLNEVWFVVSPQNPFKRAGNLAHEQDRYRMVQLAIEDNWSFKASDIEFQMPRPSYTADTLAWLSDRHPQHEFMLIMGEDNLKSFPKWKNYTSILANYGLIVYPRPGISSATDHSFLDAPQSKILRVDAPLLDISATHIRSLINRDIRPKYLLAESVIDFILSKGLFKA